MIMAFGAAELPAQPIILPISYSSTLVYAPPLWPPYAPISTGLVYQGKRFSFAMVTNPQPFGWYPPPYPYPYYYGYPFTGVSYRSIYVNYSPPPVPFAPLFVPDPPNAEVRNAMAAREPDDPNLAVIRPRPPGEADPNLLVIRPRARDAARDADRAAAPQPPRPAAEAPPGRRMRPGDEGIAAAAALPAPRPAAEAGRPIWVERGPLPRPPAALADARAESTRQIGLGKEAFARQEYGRAADRFRQAVQVAPAEPMGHFLLAQALFALGRYPEAVAAIHAGLRQKPDFPTEAFAVKELYGANAADLADQVRQIQEAIGRHNDPVLLFLCAYQLWFDGRQDESRNLFRRAAPLVADTGFIDRFLQARPPGPVAAR